ncbi:hypothetical protein V3C99_012616, partial [Haemonchus contortus]
RLDSTLRSSALAFIVDVMLYSCNFGVFSSYFRRKFGGFMLPKDRSPPHLPGTSFRSESLSKIRKIPLHHKKHHKR